jgi:hypothetical protein
MATRWKAARRTSFRTLPRSAPRTMRMPISLVRWATEYAVTPEVTP